MKAIGITLVTFLLSVWVSPLHASDAYSPLMSMDLETLMDLNVTTVARRTQNLMQTASAIYVIGHEQIRRSGATSLPEVLELAPGIDVSRINSFLWGVSARGLKAQFANKLLVMVDGRSVYNPYFAGVFWDSLLPPLNDIDRIEIIRGPGASVWGSNAVNGVINILTYDSEITTDFRATVGAGNEERGFLRARQGFKKGTLTGRLSAEYRNADEAYNPLQDSGAGDDFNTGQFSTRFDWRPSLADIISFDSGYTETREHEQFYVEASVQPFEFPRTSYGTQGEWLQGSWLHAISGGGDNLQIKSYLDHENRLDAVYHYWRTTKDLDLQFNGAQRDGHTLTSGVNYRQTQDQAEGNYLLQFIDSVDHYDRYTGFVQDEIELSRRWIATVGLKIENSDFTPVEYQPSARLAWLFSDRLTLWSALSHAVRTPSPAERVIVWRHGGSQDVNAFVEQYNLGDPDKFFVEIQGNPDFQSENIDTLEIGVRGLWGEHLYVEVATYLSRYKHLQGFSEPYFRMDFPAPTYFSGIIQTNNAVEGNSDGVEFDAQLEINQQWAIKSGYSYSHFDSDSTLVIAPDYYASLERTTPRHKLYLLSQQDVGDFWEWDIKFSYEDSARYVSSIYYEAKSHFDLSVRAAYSMSPQWQIALVGKQLLDPSRTEMVAAELGPIQTEIQRSLFLQSDWTY